MSTTYNATHTVADFKAKFNPGKIAVKHSASGKPFAVSETGMEFKVSPAAELAMTSAPETLRISECSDETKSFFMIHVKSSDADSCETVFMI